MMNLSFARRSIQMHGVVTGRSNSMISITMFVTFMLMIAMPSASLVADETAESHAKLGTPATSAVARDAAKNANFSPGISLQVEIPQLNVSEYHRPYVAIWVEDENNQVAANLTVWYQLDKNEEGAGTKWLPDLRQWWRRTGRELDMPVDGVSAPTKPVGVHSVAFDRKEKLGKLAAGKYVLIVEGVREVGGRELVKIPFDWPVAEDKQLTASGKSELGLVKAVIHTDAKTK